MNEDEEANNLITHHELLKNRMAIQNNVVNKRREQLKAWEKSEMNKLPAVRKPPCTSHVKFQDSDIFFSACVSGDEDEVEDLLEKGANINTSTIDGVTALHQAVIDNKFEMVKFLVNHGSDINAQDNEGWTPLHAAVCCGNISIVKFLCEKGADITAANSDKELAVDLAEDDEIKAYLEERLALRGVTADDCRGHEEKVIMLDCLSWIKAGNYSDKPHNKTGATALHVAASKGYNKLISLLVQAGADVNAQDLEGWTPLHAAAHWGEKDACRILLNRGADINKRTITGQDVLQVADSSIVDFLEQTSPSNTSSSISSIQTRSRSITPEEASSSSLYSSDQSVAFTVKIPTTQQSTVHNNSSSTNQSSTSSSDKQQVSTTNYTVNSTTKNATAAQPIVNKVQVETPVKKETIPPPVPPKSAVSLTRIASPSSESSSISESSSATMSSRRPKIEMTSPTVNPIQPVNKRIVSNLTTPTIASVTRRRLPTTPAPVKEVPVVTNPPPWVNHWRTPQGSIQVGRNSQQRAPSVASSTSSTATETSAQTTPATSPAPGLKSPGSQAIQASPAYKKYATTTFRSWQTPPQQPTPQKESEAERKAKSRLQRASRRSTQGVTLEQLNEARSTNSPTVNSSNNLPVSNGTPKNEDIGKWKSTALQQQSNKYVSSKDASTSDEVTSSQSTTSSVYNSTSTTSLKPNVTVTGSISSMKNNVQTNAPTLPTETPSAAKMQQRNRRVELQRSNRRSSSPVNSDMLNSISSSASLTNTTTTGRDQKQTSSSQQFEDGTKSPTAIVQPMQSSPPTPTSREIPQKPYFAVPRITALQDRVNSIDDVKKESISDDNLKPPVIPRTQPSNSAPKNESFQNGTDGLKEATFGSTGDSHYKALYEKTLVENERLRNQLEDAKVQNKKDQSSESLLSNGTNSFITMRKNYNNNSNSSNSSSPAVTPSTGNSAHLDDSDRRAYERKISELEYELQKAKQLQSDHKRLKDENNALIRVISKLSKDYPRQTINNSSSTPSSTGAQTKSTVSGVSIKHSTHS